LSFLSRTSMHSSKLSAVWRSKENKTYSNRKGDLISAFSGVFDIKNLDSKAESLQLFNFWKCCSQQEAACGFYPWYTTITSTAVQWITIVFNCWHTVEPLTTRNYTKALRKIQDIEKNLSLRKYAYMFL